MADIMDYLKQIKEAVFGKEVRQAIHDGIQQCYYDGKAGSIDLEGRQIAEAAIETEKTARQKEIAAERARIDRIVNQTNITGIQRMLLVSGETQISNKEEMWGFVWNASGTSDLESIKTKHPFVIDVYLREAGSSNVGISMDTRYRYSIDTSSSTDLTVNVTFTNNKVAAEDATEKTYNVEACVILGYDCDIPEENNEIADLRIDVDGNTHESAGSAVRAQIRNIQDSTMQLDETLTDSTKAAPADKVGELKKQIENQGTEISETVQQAKTEIQAEGTKQVENVQAAAEEITGKVEQIQQNASDVAEIMNHCISNLAFATNESLDRNNITIISSDGKNIINGTPNANISLTINEFVASKDAILKLSGFDSEHSTSIIYLTDKTTGEYSSNCYGGTEIDVNVVSGHTYTVGIYIPGYTIWNNYLLDAKLYCEKKSDAIEMFPICLTSNNTNIYLHDVNDALANTKYRISSRVIPQNMPPKMPNPLNCYIETLTTDAGNIQYIKDFDTDRVLWKRLETGIWESIEHHITVGLGYGNWDFDKLYDALLFAYSNDNTTIDVYDGTYDLIVEMGEDLDSQSIGILIGKNTTINFSPHAYVTCNYTGDDPNIKGIFSPFYCGMGDYEINNMKLSASNVRYCVHDEKSDGGDKYSHVYSNCKMYLDNRDNTEGYPQCIGGGLGKNGHIEIIGCAFKSETVSESGEKAEVSYHNSSASGAKSEVIVKDNYFENGTFRISYYGESAEKTYAYVSNNSVKYEPYVTQESASYDLQNVVLRAWNNEIHT